MVKTLLLLGLLRSQEMHGYQLNEMLVQDMGTAITLKKSNAYKLLGKMEVDGWITSHEERVGNRPPRRVYSVTSDGEAAFQRLLRENLASYETPDFPSVVAIHFLHSLPAKEATTLLLQRRQQIEKHFHRLDELDEATRRSHPSFEFLHRHYVAELGWLDELIVSLQPSQATGEQAQSDQGEDESC